MTPEPYREPELDQLARRIRTAFIEEKGRALRRTYKPSARHDNMDFYRAAARNVLELKCDPVDFVQAAVSYCRIKGGPFASQLGGKAARGWYQQRCQSLGISSGENKSSAFTESQDDAAIEVRLPCDVRLQNDINVVLCTLKNNTGSIDPSHPENAKILNDDFYRLPVSALALMGDLDVLRKFGAEILEFYGTHPNFLEAARLKKYPIDEILSWIKINYRYAR